VLLALLVLLLAVLALSALLAVSALCALLRQTMIRCMSVIFKGFQAYRLT
jgi:hypothetical protein